MNFCGFFFAFILLLLIGKVSSRSKAPSAHAAMALTFVHCDKSKQKHVLRQGNPQEVKLVGEKVISLLCLIRYTTFNITFQKTHHRQLYIATISLATVRAFYSSAYLKAC